MDPRICPVCTTLQTTDTKRCVWCDWQRPSKGWPGQDTLADAWIGESLPGNLTVAQRLSSADSLYRATDRSGRNFFAKFCAIHRLATPTDWLERSKALKSVRSRHFARFVGALEYDEYAVFVSDYVEGERLHDRLRRSSPINVDLALSIAVQIAVAMESLHAVGLTHARLDPRSVVIHTDARGEVRATVCSFGLAMGIRPEVTAPEYLPPSRRSFGSQADDIFAVGAILFEMLTGTNPRDGMVDPDIFDIAPSPLRNPQELNPILHRYHGLDTLVRDLTASEDFRVSNISTVVELLEHARQNASTAKPSKTMQRPRTFTGATHQTGLGSQAHSTATGRPKTDGRRKAVVPFEGEEHIVKLRGTELKLRTLSGSNRWGPQSTRFDLRDHGISGTLECVASLDHEIWFGTSTGVLGVFNVDSREVRQIGAVSSGSELVAVAVREGLVVAGARNGTTLHRSDQDGVVRETLGERPVSHVSVADRADRFAVGRLDGTVEIHMVDTPGSIILNEFVLDEVTGIALSVAGRQIALSDHTSTVVRDVATGDRLGDFGQFAELISTSDVIRALTTSLSE